MDALIQKARIHLLYSHQETGAKLKVLNALQSNGHLIVNSKIISGTELEKYCTVCESSNEFIKAIQIKIEQELTEEAFLKRSNYIIKKMNNKENCKVIDEILM
jgi:hypothetical protein